LSTESSYVSLIDKQLRQLQQLEIIIDSEKEILQAQNPNKLVEVTEHKNQLLIAIQSLDQEFEQSLQFKK